ncbi:hypothetical protein PQG67_07785, partial [Corynebacterium pseudodiphtheriticum]|uniref:GA module-containing protein n=2 Tax=Corynebacterium pseudodiphtheriticum TaxID=37637 RepID=UPI00234C6B6F
YALERLVKKYFAELVDSGDVKLGEQYASPAPDAYFASYKKIISADLRSMVGKTDDAVNQITDKHFDELKRVGFTFGDEQAEGAWKSDFRELVQELANELQAAEAGAHRAVLDNELGVNSNPVVDPNEESLTAEDLAAPFAKHRDEVAEQEAVEAAEDLVEAKRAAKAAIDGAQHLSDAQKVAYKGAVDAASTERQVEELVYGALDGAEQAEDYAKIQEQLGSNGTPAFSPNEKPWTPEDFLNSFRQNAANEAAKKLEETKSAATADVEGAARLTEYQKSEFKDRIGAAKTVEEVKAVLDEAHKLVDKLASEDEEKATLEKEKQEAHRIIDGLNKLSLEQKAAFKKQVDDANTGAYVAHIVERAQEVNAQQYPSGDGAGAQEPGKPGSDNKPGQDQKPGSTTDAFKGFFGLAAGLGVFALIFGGILHTINHFDGFGVVQEHVRNAFAKIGIRF